MTDVRQFGDRATRSFDCGRCEAMLADAVDGMLSQEEQQFFDAHIAECGPCAQLLAEARRGTAWLEMLRTPAPEPSPALLEKILTQTSGMALPVPLAPAPAMAPGYSNVLHFPSRQAGRTGFGRILFEPRMAMTAAMAFFSIALTLDLMGVNPLSLRAGDLSPSSLNRSFTDTRMRVVQYYEGLRVVYELESRVHDFENVQENARDATPAQNQQQSDQNAPAAQSPDTDQQAQPLGEDQTSPAAQPENNQDKAAPQNQQQQPNGKSSLEPRSEPNSHVSHREESQTKALRGTLSAFTRSPKADRSVSDAALADEILNDEMKEYLGGISSAVYTGPLPEHAERRAA